MTELVCSRHRKPGAAWSQIGIWYGAPLMVSYGLLTFLMQGGMIARAFKGALGQRSARDAEGRRDARGRGAPIVVSDRGEPLRVRHHRARMGVLRDSAAPGGARRVPLVLPDPRIGARHRGDERDADGADGEDHAAHLRRPDSPKRGRQPGHRGDHRELVVVVRRPAQRLEGGLFARGEPATPVRRPGSSASSSGRWRRRSGT